MISIAMVTWRAAVIGRWTARIAGTLIVLFFLAFLLGEGPPSVSRMTAHERMFGLGVFVMLVGLVLAWFREGWGGAASVAGWGFLALIARRGPWNLPFLLPAVIGAVHILCWWRLSGPAPPLRPMNPAMQAGLRIVFPVLWVALAGFVVLAANEAFGMPPLMTPAFHPSPDMVGTWHATLTTVSRQHLPGDLAVEFTIGPDGSVTGSVGGAAVNDGRIVWNRSWFGRLMKWRTEYLIRGTLSRVVEAHGTAGDRFTAPVNPRSFGLGGSLFLSHPSAPKPLGLDLRRGAQGVK